MNSNACACTRNIKLELNHFTLTKGFHLDIETCTRPKKEKEKLNTKQTGTRIYAHKNHTHLLHTQTRINIHTSHTLIQKKRRKKDTMLKSFMVMSWVNSYCAPLPNVTESDSKLKNLHKILLTHDSNIQHIINTRQKHTQHIINNDQTTT